MGTYGTRRNYNAHNFNTSTFLIDGNHKVEGVHRVKVGYTKPRTTVHDTADGQAQFAEETSKVGQWEIELAEASTTSTKMWDLWEAGASFSVAFTDSNIEKLSASSQKTRFGDLPPFERNKEPGVVVFTLETTYLDARGGGFALESA